jgi:hypothetical protein
MEKNGKRDKRYRKKSAEIGKKWKQGKERQENS